MMSFVRTVDQVNAFIGRLFSWSILLLTAVICYEVFSRYALRAPTTWAFDMSYMLYGLLFMMAGAYTLAVNGHVRGDFLYRRWQPRTQAKVELTCLILFFFPGILAMVFSGWVYFHLAYVTNERSPFSPAGLLLWPFKGLIPLVGVMMTLQGIAELFRCIICLQTGAWPRRLHDVQELETKIMEETEAKRRQGVAV